MNATDLLNISKDRPEILFASTEPEAKDQRRKLMREWHPDHCKDPKAADVTSHINILYEAAIERIKSGNWVSQDTLTFEAVGGTTHSYAFARRHQVEIGEIFIGPLIIFKVDNAYKDLLDNAAKTIGSLKFESQRMFDEFGRQLPQEASIVESKDATYVIVPNVQRDILLADLLPLDPKHVAWVISRLLNLRCYFNHTGIMHGGIDERAIFIDTANHSIRLLGGWNYSCKIGHKMSALPGKALSILPLENQACRLKDRR